MKPRHTQIYEDILKSLESKTIDNAEQLANEITKHTQALDEEKNLAWKEEQNKLLEEWGKLDQIKLSDIKKAQYDLKSDETKTTTKSNLQSPTVTSPVSSPTTSPISISPTSLRAGETMEQYRDRIDTAVDAVKKNELTIEDQKKALSHLEFYLNQKNTNVNEVLLSNVTVMHPPIFEEKHIQDLVSQIIYFHNLLLKTNNTPKKPSTNPFAGNSQEKFAALCSIYSTLVIPDPNLKNISETVEKALANPQVTGHRNSLHLFKSTTHALLKDLQKDVDKYIQKQNTDVKTKGLNK